MKRNESAVKLARIMDGEESEIEEKDSSVCEGFRCENRITTVR